MNDLQTQSRMPQTANSDFYARILGAMPPASTVAPYRAYGAAASVSESHVSRLPAFLQSKVAGSNRNRDRPLLLPEFFQIAGSKRPAHLAEAFPADFLLFGCAEIAALPVTVVLEGRSICQRICLQEHSSYETFAQALRKMFEDLSAQQEDGQDSNASVSLANAVPGHVIAYEDIEGDLLLAGDLTWKDFVRAAKRIRILPAKRKIRC